jgi:hypothetical protein
MKNTPSTSSHDSIFLPETPESVIHTNVETHEEISEEDNNIVARKSKRRRVAKSFGEDYIIYLWMTLPQPLLRHIHLLTMTCRRKLFKVRWTLLCLMELGKWLTVHSDAN